MRAVIAIAIAAMPFVSANADELVPPIEWEIADLESRRTFCDINKEWLAAFLAGKRVAIPLAKLRADVAECEADIAAFQGKIVDRILSAPVAGNAPRD